MKDYPSKNDIAKAGISYALGNGLPVFVTTSTWQAAIQWYITITQKQQDNERKS